jgi:hypothetical protein
VLPSLGVHEHWKDSSSKAYSRNLGTGSGIELVAINTFTDVAPQTAAVPHSFMLYDNFPNPFNPSTTIRFSLSGPAAVSLRIYDAGGRLVRTLVEEPLSAGPHERAWDGADSRGAAVSSGVYLYRLDAGSFTRTRKMILIR